MKKMILGIAAIWISMAGSVQAEQPVVIELFTSQGCSSCPPADKIFNKLSTRDDIIALSYHVDYWDYLGWKDEFAHASYSQYQRNYASANRQRSVYTPQLIVEGQDLLIGSRAKEIAASIRNHAKRPDTVAVKLSRSGGKLAVRATTKKRLPKGAVVRLITYLPTATVSIHRGENAGRKIKYNNIVRSMAVIGDWSGQSDFQAAAKVADDVPVIVLVQTKKNGPILGAAHLR